MTNFEYWKDRILEINECENVAIIYGKPIKCTSIEKCEECEFHIIGKTCRQKFVEWLYSEHAEKLKLTKRERMMCELLKTGWIAMDDDGSIFWYEKRPERDSNGYFNSYDSEFIALSNFKLQFDNVPIGVEAFAVEDLLQLEVEE